MRDGLSDEEIHDAEIALIATMRSSGQADLNLTDGGEGLLGYKKSAESREALSKKYRASGGPSAKLNWDQVREIRALRLDRYVPAAEIAAEYGVLRTAIDRILNNTMWVDEDYDPELMSPRIRQRHPQSMFTKEQVAEIRKYRQTTWESAKDLGERYGVSIPTIYGILRNRVYFDPEYDPETIVGRPYESYQRG